MAEPSAAPLARKKVNASIAGGTDRCPGGRGDLRPEGEEEDTHLRCALISVD